MKKGIIFFQIIISIVIFTILLLMGAYPGHYYRFSAASIGYCLLIYYLFTKTLTRNERITTVFIMTFPILVVGGILHTLDFTNTRLALPSNLAHIVGVFFGAIIFYSNRISVKIILSFILVSGSLWITFYGYAMWEDKINYGTYTGVVEEATPVFVFADEQEVKFSNIDIKNKIVVLDFWNTRCGICFQKFPIFQKLFDNYHEDSTIKIIAVNIPLKQDTIGQAFKIMHEFYYSFPVMILNETTKKNCFGIQVFPTTVIIDQDGNVIYKGKIDNVEKIIKRLKGKEI